MNKRWALSLALVALFALVTSGAIYVILYFKSEASTTTPSRPTYVVEVQEIKGQPFEEYLSGLGSLEALRRSKVVSEVNGYVSYIDPKLEAGQRVTAGDVLIKVAPERTRLEMERAEQALARAQANLERVKKEKEDYLILKKIYGENLKLARRQAKETQVLVKKEVASKYDLDSAQLRVRMELANQARAEANLHLIPPRLKEARAVVELRQRELELARRNHHLSSVSPPFTGYILHKNVEKGEKTSPGGFFFEIIGEKLVAKVDFPSEDLSQIKIGQEAEIRASAFSEKWRGKVTRIHPQIHPTHRTITVYIHLESTSSLLRPGLFVEAKVKISEHQKAIVIPRTALRERETVFVLQDGLVKRKSLTIGRYLKEKVLVEKGLKEGEKVILSQMEDLFEGMKAKTRKESSPSTPQSVSSLEK